MWGCHRIEYLPFTFAQIEISSMKKYFIDIKTVASTNDVKKHKSDCLTLQDLSKKRSTEGCSKLKRPETRHNQERLVSILEHMQVP